QEMQEMFSYVTENIENATPQNITSFLKSCRQEDSPLGGDCNTPEHPRWEAHPVHFGNNKTGFSALPGGSRNYTGNYYYGLGTIAYWWTSTQLDATTAWHYRFRFDQ
ncbi:FISUMP domain-containing protein, partial [Arthrospira platensis SPKY1]|nr:FISUMP domain-containing protein [Arthrospira platensis SPKY1]